MKQVPCGQVVFRSRVPEVTPGKCWLLVNSYCSLYDVVTFADRACLLLSNVPTSYELWKYYYNYTPDKSIVALISVSANLSACDGLRCLVFGCLSSHFLFVLLSCVWAMLILICISHILDNDCVWHTQRSSRWTVSPPCEYVVPNNSAGFHYIDRQFTWLFFRVRQSMTFPRLW